jgi:hypothetical protein
MKQEQRQRYPTDLTDAQWAVVERAMPGSRERSHRDATTIPGARTLERDLLPGEERRHVAGAAA